MDLGLFKQISEHPVPRRALVWQDWREWQAFLEFAAAYFAGRSIEHPLVVEIGVMHNEQREFYRKLMGAEHIGIDIDVNNAPDILGDSTSPETFETVKIRLAGREIDLLFIDGNHSEAGVRKDYELYGPLARHLVAFHDVGGTRNRAEGVNAFWQEMEAAGGFMTAVFHRSGQAVSLADNLFTHMGIGVIIKG